MKTTDSNKKLIALGLGLIALLAIGWKYHDIQKPRIYLSFYGDHKKTLRYLIEATELFRKLNQEYILALGIQNNIDDHLSEIHRSYQKSTDKDIIFAPMGSQASDKFVSLNVPKRDEKYFIMQVTASHNFLKSENGLSVFLPAQDYLNGVVPMLLSIRGKPRLIHIIQNKDVAYLEQTTQFIMREMGKYELNFGRIVAATSHDLKTKFELFVKEGKLHESDWIIFIDNNPLRYLNSIEKFNAKHSEVLRKSEKIFTYGSADTKLPADLLSNSTQALFWHPKINYDEHGSLSNCDFVESFFKQFGHYPDFHAAFLFSSLEYATKIKTDRIVFSKIKEAFVPTILGKLSWTESGTQRNIFPIFYRFDKDLNPAVYSYAKNLKSCRNFSIPIKEIMF